VLVNDEVAGDIGPEGRDLTNPVNAATAVAPHSSSTVNTDAEDHDKFVDALEDQDV